MPITPRSSWSGWDPNGRSSASAGLLDLDGIHVGPGPVAAELVEERQRLERLHSIEEQHAVEVIGLVLDDARGETARLHLEALAAAIVGAHEDLSRARHT